MTLGVVTPMLTRIAEAVDQVRCARVDARAGGRAGGRANCGRGAFGALTVSQPHPSQPRTHHTRFPPSCCSNLLLSALQPPTIV